MWILVLQTGRRQHRNKGFSLVELLVVIAIIAILAGLLLPALVQAKHRVYTAACKNNLHQLQLCWHQYTHDNEGYLPPNNFVYLVDVGGNPNPRLGEDAETWCKSIAPLDPDPIDETVSVLFIYNRSPAIYRCPADRSTVRDHPGKPRNRSYNMSNSIFCRSADHFKKENEIRRPGVLFVFIDTHEDTIWDSTFGVIPLSSPWRDYWLDVPADRHHCGANLTFADGHVEYRKWRSSKKGLNIGSHAKDELDLQDLRSLQMNIKGANGN